MKILVLNCGSSSLKYKLVDMPRTEVLAGGEAQRVGPPTAKPSRLLHRVGNEEEITEVKMPDHGAAFEQVLQRLQGDPRLRPDAVGHRLVHGGALFSLPTIMDTASLDRLESINGLAPIHNPPAVALMRVVRARSPELPQVAVFDTAFHASIPEPARTYALPRLLCRELGLRKYGFHGTSHQYVMEEAASFLKRPVAQFNAVSCHLGSGGASLCAIVNGQSVDNTMGFSPLQGLVMSTRCGDLDPAVALRLLTLYGSDSAQVTDLLNNRSGVLGLSGVSADIRDILTQAAGNPTGRLGRLHQTAQVYLWRLRKYLGAYLTVVGRTDAIIFTDTIGETVPLVRWALCSNLEVFGVRIDAEKNQQSTPLPLDIAATASPVRILVIATDEERAIAKRTYETLTSKNTCSR